MHRFDFRSVLAHSWKNNVSLLQQEGTLKMREYDIKSTTSNMIPKLSVNAGIIGVKIF